MLKKLPSSTSPDQLIREAVKLADEASSAARSWGTCRTLGAGVQFSLELAMEASKGIPVVPVQAIPAVALLIWNTIETTKENKEKLQQLVEDCLNLARTIMKRYYDANTKKWHSKIPDDHRDTVLRLIRLAYDVYYNAQKLNARPWFYRFFMAKLDVKTIKKFQETLDRAKSDFHIEKLVEIEHKLTDMIMRPPQASPAPGQVTFSRDTASSTFKHMDNPSMPPPSSSQLASIVGAADVEIGGDYTATTIGNTYEARNFFPGNVQHENRQSPPAAPSLAPLPTGSQQSASIVGPAKVKIGGNYTASTAGHTYYTRNYDRGNTNNSGNTTTAQIQNSGNTNISNTHESGVLLTYGNRLRLSSGHNDNSISSRA